MSINVYFSRALFPVLVVNKSCVSGIHDLEVANFFIYFLIIPPYLGKL